MSESELLQHSSDDHDVKRSQSVRPSESRWCLQTLRMQNICSSRCLWPPTPRAGHGCGRVRVQWSEERASVSGRSARVTPALHAPVCHQTDNHTLTRKEVYYYYSWYLEVTLSVWFLAASDTNLNYNLFLDKFFKYVHMFSPNERITHTAIKNSNYCTTVLHFNLNVSNL